MNVLSLFDGMSCGQIALNRAGIKYDNYFASEIDKDGINVTMHNYPNTIQLGDIFDIKKENLPKIDLIFGGSPCQSFSQITSSKINRKGYGFEGKSGLFWEFVRVLNEVNPTYFFFENVTMLKEWEHIISIALKTEPIMFNSALVSAHSRQRNYWTNIPRIKPIKDRGILFQDIMDKEAPFDKDFSKDKGLFFINIPQSITQPKFKRLMCRRVNARVFRIVDGKKEYRYLTPNECEMLQTVPIDYTLPAKTFDRRLKMLGNGWTVDVVAHCLDSLKSFPNVKPDNFVDNFIN